MRTPDWRRFDKPAVGKAAYASTIEEAKAELKALTGKDQTVDSDQVFIIALDGDFSDSYVLATLDVDGKSYAIATVDKVAEGTKALYFSLKSGKQINFVDGVKATGEGVDLSTFKGTIVLSVYTTDPQTADTYPTGLKLIKRATYDFNQRASKAYTRVKQSDEFLGVKYADLGEFSIDGLTVTGTAKQATAQGWNGEGQDKTGYFIGLHIRDCAKLITEKHPEGKTSDDGDWLLLLGEDAITLKWFDVQGTDGKTDRYVVDVSTAS